MARRRTVPNPEPITMLTLLAIGGAAFAGYELVWLPMARKKTEEDLLKAAKKKGGELDDALKGLGKAGCQSYAAANGLPASSSGSLCAAVAALGVGALKYGEKYGVKGAKVLGKDIGKGTVAAAKGVGSAAKKTAKAVESVASHLKFWGLEGLHA